MSPSLKGRSCTCADRTSLLYTLDIGPSPPSVDYDEHEADMETPLASLFNENPSFESEQQFDKQILPSSSNV